MLLTFLKYASPDHDNPKEGCLIFHCEAQSKAEHVLPARILHYKMAFALDYTKKHRTKQAPSIVSIVLYNGKQSPYPNSMQIEDVFTDKDIARQFLLNPISY